MILVNRAELKENVIQQVVGICRQHKANQTASPHSAKWWRGQAGTGDRHLKQTNKKAWNKLRFGKKEAFLDPRSLSTRSGAGLSFFQFYLVMIMYSP